MFAVYLAATILGCSSLGASLLFGHHGGGHEVEHGTDESGHAGSASGLIFSLRFWTYLFAFGGLSGMLLRRFGEVHEPWAAMLSIGVGAVTGLAAQVVIAKLGGDSGGTVQPRDFVYKLGTMLLPASPGISSRVRVTIDNQIVDLIAITDDPAIAAREEVIVLEIKDGVAQVTRNQPAGEKP